MVRTDVRITYHSDFSDYQQGNGVRHCTARSKGRGFAVFAAVAGQPGPEECVELLTTPGAQTARSLSRFPVNPCPALVLFLSFHSQGTTFARAGQKQGIQLTVTSLMAGTISTFENDAWA